VKNWDHTIFNFPTKLLPSSQTLDY